MKIKATGYFLILLLGAIETKHTQAASTAVDPEACIVCAGSDGGLFSPPPGQPCPTGSMAVGQGTINAIGEACRILQGCLIPILIPGGNPPADPDPTDPWCSTLSL